MKSLVVFLLAVSIFANVRAFYEDFPLVTVFKDHQPFVDQVLSSTKIWVVEFYAPWCKYCQAFTPEFKKAAENLNHMIKFGAVNCDEEGAKPLCGHFNVQSLPSVLLFKSELEQAEVDGKKAYTKNPVVFDGTRKAANVANWALNYLPDRVPKVTADSVDGFITFGNRPEFAKMDHSALVFTNKDKPSNLLKALVLDFYRSVTGKMWLPIGLVSHTETALVEKYGISKFPSLIVLSKKGDVHKFDGEFDYVSMFNFLQPYAYIPTVEDMQGPPPKAGKQESKPSPSPPKEPVLSYIDSQADYDSACKSFGLCLVAFLDPSSESHKTEIEVLNSLVTKYKSLNIMWVNGPRHPTFASSFPIADGFPQAAIFHRKKLKVRVLKSAWELELMSEFVDNTLSGKGRTMQMDGEPKFGEPVELPPPETTDGNSEKEDL